MRMREAFHHGGLADARFAGEDGVVLAAARQDIDHLADLEIAAQHGIDLALLGVLGEVDGVLIEVGRLAARLGGARRRPAAEAGACRRIRRVLARIRQDGGQYFAQRLGLNLLNSLLTSRTMRDSSSSETSARMAKPERTWPAPKSSEPMVQASVSMRRATG